MFRIPGAPTPAQVSRTRAGAQQVKGPSFKYTWDAPLDARNAPTDFPIVPTPSDMYDDTANIKNIYAQRNVGSNWVVPFEQSDAEYIMRKRDTEENAEFDQWLYNRYDLKDPAQNLMLQQIAPDLYSRREEVINYNQDLVSRYAKLRLRGPKSEEDFRFEWLIETGRMELPQGPVWDPQQWRRNQQTGGDAGLAQVVTPAEDKAWNRNRYVRGMFNPLSFLTQENAAWNANELNRFDIRGNPRSPQVNMNIPYPGGGLGEYNTNRAAAQGWRPAYQGNLPATFSYPGGYRANYEAPERPAE